MIFHKYLEEIVLQKFSEFVAVVVDLAIYKSSWIFYSLYVVQPTGKIKIKYPFSTIYIIGVFIPRIIVLIK